MVTRRNKGEQGGIRGNKVNKGWGVNKVHYGVMALCENGEM